MKEQDKNSLIFDMANIFWQFFAQSSHSMRLRVIYFILANL